MSAVTQLRVVSTGLVGVREMAARFGVSKSTLYELIKTDPTFPFKNVGVRKKLMIDAEKFEMWLDTRTEKQKEERFGLPTASGLLERFKK